MKETIKYSLPSLIVALAMIVFFLFFLKGCFQAKPQPIITVQRDTQYIQQPPVIIPQYQPVVIKSEAPNPVIIPQQYKEPTSDINELKQQIKDLADQFYAVNHYKDSLQLKDSAGNRVGVVNMEDAVSQNEIQSRNPSNSLRLPVITNTITIDHPYEAKNRLYLGGGVLGNRIDLLTAIKAGLILKNKKDNIIEVNATVNKGLGIGAEVGYYHKISFK